MKYAFVRFIEDHGVEHGGRMPCVSMAKGEAAESQEAFISWYDPGCEVTIISWFEVPENWENGVTGDAEEPLNEALSALLALEALAGKPVVSDLLATIFDAGFNCGERYGSDLQAAFARGGASAKQFDK